MTEYATLEDLALNDFVDLEGEDFTLPGGQVVRIRGLTRYELILNGKNTEDSALIERRNVACCLVAPRMSVGQVESWQRTSRAGGAFAALSAKIRDLSGLGEDAAKSDPGEPGDH